MSGLNLSGSERDSLAFVCILNMVMNYGVPSRERLLCNS